MWSAHPLTASATHFANARTSSSVVSNEHIHRTIHMTGPRATLDVIARATLGVDLDEITRALPMK